MEAWVFVDPADDIMEGSEDNNIAGAELPACEIAGIDDLTARPKRTKVSLRWSPVDGATGYNVYRGETPGGPYTLLAADRQSPWALYLDDGLGFLLHGDIHP